MKTVVITTLGCKVNQYESASFDHGFAERGLVVGKGEDADLVVINTCAVTGSAGAQSRRALLQALRRHPRAKIVVCGCYVELEGKRLAEDERLAGREVLFVGNSAKDQLVSLALATPTPHPLQLGDIAAATSICRLPVRTFSKRARAYLRIQDGCQSYCSYCIVPSTRGPSRSLPPQEVIEQAKIFALSGHREIVLTGIHLGNYGKDLSPTSSLVSLLDTLTLATPTIGYRISSLEPTEIDSQLLTLIGERPNIRHHLHIPLQSGCNEILRRMNRRYTTEQFAATVATCHAMLPDAAIGIDILVGFPGENTTHFDETRRFLESLPCSYLHVFPYSIRPGTKAASFADQVEAKEKTRRVAELRSLSAQKSEAFQRRHLGTTRLVLAEGYRGRQGMLHGFTDNYISVQFPGTKGQRGEVLPVKLLTLSNDHVTGEIAQQ